MTMLTHSLLRMDPTNKRTSASAMPAPKINVSRAPRDINLEFGMSEKEVKRVASLSKPIKSVNEKWKLLPAFLKVRIR